MGEDLRADSIPMMEIAIEPNLGLYHANERNRLTLESRVNQFDENVQVDHKESTVSRLCALRISVSGSFRVRADTLSPDAEGDVRKRE